MSCFRSRIRIAFYKPGTLSPFSSPPLDTHDRRGEKKMPRGVSATLRARFRMNERALEIIR